MKNLLFAAILLPATVLAQTTQKTATPENNRVNSLGIISESNSANAVNDIPSMGVFGLQYRRQVRPHCAYSIMAAYGSYNSMPSTTRISTIKDDTAYGRSISTKAGLGLLGFALEADRQFYKKVYFFAGADLRGGYGTGTRDTNLVRSYNYTSVDPVTGNVYQGIVNKATSADGPAVSMVNVALTPYVGVKLELRRIAFGLAVVGGSVAYTSIKPQNGSASSLVDFDLGNISRRLFFRYKF